MVPKQCPHFRLATLGLGIGKALRNEKGIAGLHPQGPRHFV
jgi:hypothetical protein